MSSGFLLSKMVVAVVRGRGATLIPVKTCVVAQRELGFTDFPLQKSKR